VDFTLDEDNGRSTISISMDKDRKSDGCQYSHLSSTSFLMGQEKEVAGGQKKAASRRVPRYLPSEKPYA